MKKEQDVKGQKLIKLHINNLIKPRLAKTPLYRK
jgi:hypothetical protein